MKKNNLIRFVQSLVLFPVMTMSLSFPGMPNLETSQNVLAKKVNIEADGTVAINQAIIPDVDVQTKEDPKGQILKAEAAAIDAYFGEHDMPLKGLGMKMALEADKNDIDWRLLPAISVRESTGGKNACNKAKHNFFGWGSCKVGFSSDEAAIETVAKNLGGNNPTTAHHYDNKSVKEILNAYNPPSIVPKYTDQVMTIMNTIGSENMTQATLASSNNT